jgi:hypothetical protein
MSRRRRRRRQEAKDKGRRDEKDEQRKKKKSMKMKGNMNKKIWKSFERNRKKMLRKMIQDETGEREVRWINMEGVLGG